MADDASSGDDIDVNVDTARAWGASTMPVLAPGAGAPPQAHSSSGNTQLSQLHVPIGIGVPGSTVTVPATITSPEHLAAYADYCKRALSNAVNGPLLGKRDAVLHQLSRVQGRADELRAVAADVERAVRCSADDAVEQLRGLEARRQALLAAQVEELMHSVEALDRAAESAAAACAAAERPLVFLQRFRALTDACERLALKPLREDIEVSVEDFEVDARAAVASQAERDNEVLQTLLTVKDQMIWSLIEERDALRERLQGDSAAP